MNRKKGIRILLTVLTVAALLAAGGYALWKNGFFEKINSVEALREVIAGTGMWAGGVYFALQMMTVIIAPIPSNISMMAGALALGFWPAMILGVLAVGVGSVIVFLAARALGASPLRILRRHILPGCAPVILTAAAAQIPSAIFTESFLSFIGLGEQPPTPSFGTMISEGSTYMPDYWWMTAFPALAIVFVILGFNFLGDGIRDMLDRGKQ